MGEAVRSITVAGERQEPSDLRTKLAGELLKIRRAGLHHHSTSLHRLEALLWIAETVGQGATNYAKVVSIWDMAAARLGEVYGPTTLALYGVSRNAQHLDSGARTELAYRVFCAKERENAIDGVPARKIKEVSFATHEVRQIKQDILAGLLQLLEEKPRVR
jgi:hypothetical protein